MKSKTLKILEEFKNTNDLEKVKRIRDKYNNKLFFVVVEISRNFMSDGKHHRLIEVKDYIQNKKVELYLDAINTCELIYNDIRDTYVDRIKETFESFEEAEKWVLEKIKEIRKRLKEIKQEYNKHEKYEEEETIFIV